MKAGDIKKHLENIPDDQEVFWCPNGDDAYPAKIVLFQEHSTEPPYEPIIVPYIIGEKYEHHKNFPDIMTNGVINLIP